ncbi:hypothetical protein Taro_015224, partial [Colocasia esculenta]|nr:hypothetical protein [Colocasia esculenta]
MHNPHDQRTQTIRENIAASRTAEATQAGPGRTSTRTTMAPFREKLPERTSRTNSAPQTLRWHDNSRNERGTVLRETLTRTTNTGQPSDAPLPRGQCNSNQKRAQHSCGETSLPPKPTEKNSRSTSLELTTSQHQADNNHRQVLQCSTSGATQHARHLLSSASRAQRTTAH